MARAEIKYSYNDPGISPALVRHLFRYIGSITDIMFREDHTTPDIVYAQSVEPPSSAMIVINSGKLYSKQISAERELLGFDPVRILADMLSISFKSGPYSPGRLYPKSPEKPTLSEMIGGFVRVLENAGLVPRGSRPLNLWPEPYKFALALTHDIDIIHRSIPGSIRLLWNRDLPGGIGALVDSVKASIADRLNPYDRIREWIKREKELGLKSSFFVFDGWRQHASDPKYTLSQLSDDLNTIKSNGFELGLHSGIGCHSGQHIAESKKSLESTTTADVHGIRPHYLSAAFPEYWRAAILAGFAYSSAFGFDEEIGFLHGIDLPVIPFDKQSDKSLDIVEIPIAIMDCGLVGRGNARSEESFEHARSLIDRCAAVGGLVVLDWHERTLYERDYPGWGNLYFKLAEYAKSKGAFITLMSDIAAITMNRFQGKP